MSYILDALRKSEQERTAGAMPMLTTPGPRMERPGTWLRWLALAASVTLLVAAALWWRGWLASPSPFVPSPPSEERAQVPSQGQVVLEPGVETAIPAPRDDHVRKPRIVSTAQVERSPPRPQPAPVPESVSGVLPSTGSLSVDVVSWSKDASRRFVMINQAIYHEGDTVPGAGVLVRIDPESVVLRSSGQERVLRP